MRKNLLLTLTLIVGGIRLGAESWPVLGSQPAAIGGSFVGMAKGPLGQFWNPAGLAQENNISGLSIPVGGRFELTGGILKDAYNISNIAAKYDAIQTAQTSSGAINADQMAAFLQGVVALDSLNKPGKGFLIDVGGGLGVKIGRFALMVNQYTEVGATPFVDIKNIGLGAISAGSGGVNFAAISNGDPADATNLASANQIETAINTIGFASVANMICGAATCPGISSPNELSNALVNQATATSTTAEIANAAQLIADNAAAAGPIIAAIVNGNNNPYTNNASNLTLRGASFTEIALGMGHQLLLPGLYVGANIKAIQGTVGYHKFQVLDKEADVGDLVKDFDRSKKDSIQPGLDVGVFYDLNKTLPVLPMRPRVGLMARNINSPEFDQPDVAKQNGESSKYRLDSQVRFGASFSPFNFWTLAADIDVTENKTPVKGFKSRMLAAGTEINVFNKSWLNIPLRAGINKNIAESKSKAAYTGGLGLNFLHVHVDLGGSISSETEKYKDKNGKTQDVPANASAHANISILF
ncbi:MAG: conjugal transfer protein TraF [Elusimicrobia bacterium]|nr:conjugal transfer protein TraF [Elusimicrobiota bacterium]